MIKEKYVEHATSDASRSPGEMPAQICADFSVAPAEPGQTLMARHPGPRACMGRRAGVDLDAIRTNAVTFTLAWATSRLARRAEVPASPARQNGLRLPHVAAGGTGFPGSYWAKAPEAGIFIPSQV